MITALYLFGIFAVIYAVVIYWACRNAQEIDSEGNPRQDVTRKGEPGL